MEEIWRDIKNYEGLYQVSNLGNVKSLERIDCLNHLRKERILKPETDKGGYLTVVLSKDKKKKNIKVHRLVAEAFIPNPHNYPQVNHKIEEDKKNNFVYINEDGTVNLEKSSIEWCTAKYNNNYGTHIERVAETQSKPVLQIDKLTNEVIAEWKSIMEVKRQLGFSNSSISNCCNSKRKSCGGFRWQFK